jgi:tetratricopeptide (TPR) repeat protein
LRRVGLARETGSEVVDRFPILATLEAMSLQAGSGGWQSMASIARSPAQAITNAPAEIRGLMTPPKQPFTPQFAPFIDGLALCEASVTARIQAETALDLRELDSKVGAQAFQPPRPDVSISEIQCAGAGAAMRTLFAVSDDKNVRDGMTAMAAPLVYGLMNIGESELARDVSSAPRKYCQGPGSSRGWSHLMGASCALMEIAGVSIDAAAPRAGREAVQRAMNSLKRVDIAKLPTPETAWFVAFAYELAAMQLDELGDLAGAGVALERAIEVVSRLSSRGRLFPAIEATSLSIVGDWADLRGRQADTEAARAAFRKAHATIGAFTMRHPNSLAACDANDELAESEITWISKHDLERALDRIDSLQPELERCGRLMDNVTGTPLRAPDGRPASLVSREFSYMEIAEAAHQAGNAEIEFAAFSRLEEMTRTGEEPTAHPWVMRSHTIYLEALGNLMQQRGDAAGALSMFQRLAKLARLTGNRSRQLIGSDRAGRLASTLGQREIAEAMWADKVRLCGTAVRHRPHRERPAALDAAMAELDLFLVDIGCFFVQRDEAESGKALFARDLAAMSDSVGGDSNEVISRRADLLFYLGLSEDSLWNLPEASAAYEKSLALRLDREQALSPSSRALTPYVMARRATLPAGEGWWPRLEAWLLKAKAARQLTRDEEDLLLLAQNKGERI